MRNNISQNKDIFVRWIFIAIVLILFIVYFVIPSITSKSANYYAMMGKTNNQIALLERGMIIDANVTNSYYEKGAPEGWRVSYDFEAIDPITHEQKVYWGWSQGPKHYYADFSVGDAVSIIYDPCDPRINCEIRSFLNYPGFRYDLKKAGKLHLLNKFKDEYELENYTFKKWYDLQWQK